MPGTSDTGGEEIAATADDERRSLPKIAAERRGTEAGGSGEATSVGVVIWAPKDHEALEFSLGIINFGII